MNAMDGGSAGDERPELDLDQPAAGDAQLTALFRAGLRPGADQPDRPDLRGIERRAKRRHRKTQALASGAVTAAAALAAVLVVVSPWSGGTDQGVPATPSPSSTQEAPEITKASLVRTEDLSDKNWSILGAKRYSPQSDPEDISGEELIGGVCVDNTFGVDAPERGWKQTWESRGTGVTNHYTITETLVQWPGQPDQGSTVLEELRSQIAGCNDGVQLEGTGPTTDYTDQQQLTVPYLAISSSDGNGYPYAQVFAVWDDTLVTVQVGGPTPPQGNEEEAYTGAMDVLDAAIYRLNDRVPGDGQPSGLQLPEPEGDQPDPYSTSEASGEDQ